MLRTAAVNAVVPCADLGRAKRFYQSTLGLKAADDWGSQGAMFEAGKGTMILLYPSEGAGKAVHTIAGFTVSDVEPTVKTLEAKGVKFEDYDMDEMKTDANHIARMGGMSSAWLRDSEGNILCVSGMH
ncbi:MAG: VOC family protein [Candidatus Kerfeldbacteria bacterium]|nr:VOC family protein [Candidatus Kerfeldbacteria bacterium]